MKHFFPHDEPVVMTMTYRGVEYRREGVMKHVQWDRENDPGFPFEVKAGHGWFVLFPDADTPDCKFTFEPRSLTQEV